MIYGTDYEGRQRECGNCGYFTNVHTYCPTCEMNVCEGCEDHHTCARKEPNAHVHPVFAQTLNSWASIGPGLYVRTAPRKKGRR